MDLGGGGPCWSEGLGIGKALPGGGGGIGLPGGGGGIGLPGGRGGGGAPGVGGGGGTGLVGGSGDGGAPPSGGGGAGGGGAPTEIRFNAIPPGGGGGGGAKLGSGNSGQLPSPWREGDVGGPTWIEGGGGGGGGGAPLVAGGGSIDPVDDLSADCLLIRLRLCIPDPGLIISSVCVSWSLLFFLCSLHAAINLLPSSCGSLLIASWAILSISVHILSLQRDKLFTTC